MPNRSDASAYGGKGWSPRNTPLRNEIGDIWGSCGVAAEWTPLKAVMLHKPGRELEGLEDADSVQMLDIPSPSKVRQQHDAMAEAFRQAGVSVAYVEPPATPPPNLMFVADLLFMTPEGAILARPASTVRAGEERYIARRLADIGIPILRSIRGTGTFEGADAAWIDTHKVMLGRGLRTNEEGIVQISSLLEEMDVEAVAVDLLPYSMHLMGEIRIVNRDLAICRTGMTPKSAVEILKEHGYDVLFTPHEEEAMKGMALNFITLGPMQIIMPVGNPATRAFYEDNGIDCATVEISELMKAAGGIGCLTGVLERELIG